MICPECDGAGCIDGLCPLCQGIGCVQCSNRGGWVEFCSECDGEGYMKEETTNAID